jgi:hypothetical protein
MLTANHPAISSAIRTETTHMGTQVFLGDILLGTIESYPVWGLDTGYDFAIAQGLTARDECYVAHNFPYRYLESAIGAITGAYLTQPATDTLPDYT